MTTALARCSCVALALTLHTACATGTETETDACVSDKDCLVTITHGAVAPVGVTEGAENGVGTVRLFHDVATFEDLGSGSFDATMTTTSVEAAAGVETRVTQLVFVLDETGDQLVVEGSSTYPAAGSTISVSQTVERPILGGSGAWAGARGTASSTHLEDDTWVHVLTLTP